MTFPSVLIIDKSVAVLPVDVTQHPTLPQPGYIAQHFRLCQQNNVCFNIHNVKVNFQDLLSVKCPGLQRIFGINPLHSAEQIPNAPAE